MSADEARQLLGGYATGNLSPAEREALFLAALEHQEVFDELVREQEWKELLDDPTMRLDLIEALTEVPDEVPVEGFAAALPTVAAPPAPAPMSVARARKAAPAPEPSQLPRQPWWRALWERPVMLATAGSLAAGAFTAWLLLSTGEPPRRTTETAVAQEVPSAPEQKQAEVARAQPLPPPAAPAPRPAPPSTLR